VEAGRGRQAVNPQTDVIAAVIEVLRETESGDATEVERKTDGRVFGGLVPLEEQGELPGPTVRVNYAGGPSMGGYAPLQRPRVDIAFYGRTFYEADELRRIAHPLLKDLQRRTAAGVLIHGIQNNGGYSQGREQGTNWPYIFTSWDVLASEI